MPVLTDAPASILYLDRQALLAALNRLKAIAHQRQPKPILQGVRLEMADGVLRLAATDLETALVITVPATGDLTPCVVVGTDLLQRIKSGHGDQCSLQLDADESTMLINGGCVEHRLPTMPVAEFPPVTTEPVGLKWEVAGPEFREALSIALRAAATESTRYAINGVLLEVEGDAIRLVATDGRRLVTVGLQHYQGKLARSVLLPQRIVELLGRLIPKDEPSAVALFVQKKSTAKGKTAPAQLCVACEDWLLSGEELEGHFPLYRDVIPPSGSRFTVDRRALLGLLDEVALAADAFNRGVRVDLHSDQVRLSAQNGAGALASGHVPAVFGGGGDEHIITGFNPAFLRDALASLPDERVVIDVQQNRPSSTDGTVCGRPALIYGADSDRVRWVLTPVAIDLSAEEPGSKSKPESPAAVDGSSAGEAVESTAVAVADGANNGSVDIAVGHAGDANGSDHATPTSRQVEHDWPTVGTKLVGRYDGQTYTALVVAAPWLKSGRAIHLIDGPACGRTCNSMTAAMRVALARQRRALGLARCKKRLPKSGWNFWRTAARKRRSA